MIFPVRCLSCGNVVGNKWDKYNELLNKKNKGKDKDDTISSHNINSLEDNKDIFNNINISRICCKRHFITHVNLYFNI